MGRGNGATGQTTTTTRLSFHLVRSDLESPLLPVTFIVLYDQTAGISEQGLLCEMRLAARMAFTALVFLLTESCS